MSPSYLLFVLVAFCALSSVLGDCYFQNPKGSNNRYNEENPDRQNANRLFNSENNARGGYCWGPELTFYEGSILSLEWTAQHSCGNSNTQCNIVVQYMCTSDAAGADPAHIIRDGKTITTIPNNDDPTTGYQAMDEAGEYVYGMHENFAYYQSCRARSRNLGLYVADQTPNNNNGAQATRQNPDATRYGFECAEEHDYYPYWHPSPWRDIVVFADKKSQCDWYQSESQNVKAKNYCNGTTDAQLAANNYDDCIRANGKWEQAESHGIDKPECKQAQWSRDNHLGNGVDGHTTSYNWTLPFSATLDCIKNGNCTCILRIRYNITVGELSGAENSLLNGIKSPIQEDPDVVVEGANYTLAINTQQISRTFQDRTHMFRIAKRPNGVPDSAKIYNLNVRGKRGNIVQTYPATEYDFVPTFLEVTQGDYVHFQWTGCDTNPGGNQGEGKTKTDRSNIVQIADMSKNYPLNATELKNAKKLFTDDNLRKRMANIDQVNCLSYEELEKAGGDIEQNAQNCMVLNQAGPRFSGALLQMKNTGKYSYMSTRNNNFSNRSQKGQITVKEGWAAWKTAVVVIGGVAAIGIGAAAGTVFYASRHPLSRVAEVVKSVPGFSRV